MDKKDKLAVLKQLQKDCAKKYGENSLVTMNKSSFASVPKIKSGIAGLDHLLGGGYGRGRVIEVGGPESSGKTTLALEAIAEIQRTDSESLCGYVDAENAFDPEYAKAIGVDLSRLTLNQPQSAEEALDIIKDMVSAEVFDIIVLDSVNAISPQAEQDKDMSSSSMGLQARLISSFLRQITPKLQKANCTLFVISQIRMKIGVMYGNPEVMGVGNALKFYASQRLDVRRIKTNEEDSEAVSNDVRIKVIKNKLAPPFRKGEFVIIFGKGFDRLADLASCAVRTGVITKKGAWLYYEHNGESLQWNGQSKLVAEMEDNSELCKKLSALTEEALKMIKDEPVEKVTKIKKVAKEDASDDQKEEDTSLSDSESTEDLASSALEK